MILENVPTSLRGELSRWMLEPKPGVFIGKLSARVRQKLWESVQNRIDTGGAWLFYSAPNEQGFQVEKWGNTTREPVDYEGIILIRKPNA
ncbi:MAG: type I-E CRISPR-associated endoribonuclease Cas2e [Candidatus Sumerlaeaceae bacterium]